MLAVSADFPNAIKADKRQVLPRVTIAYTDPFIDQSITATATHSVRMKPFSRKRLIMPAEWLWQGIRIELEER